MWDPVPPTQSSLWDSVTPTLFGQIQTPIDKISTPLIATPTDTKSTTQVATLSQAGKEELPATAPRVTFQLPNAVAPPMFQKTAAETFVAARERQCKLMSAYPTRAVQRISWPTASVSTRTAAVQRNPAWTTYSTSYMAAQARLLFLADVPIPQRMERFDEECFKRMLAPTTALSYWIGWLTMQKSIACPTCPATDSRVTKILKARAMAYPVQFPKAITRAQVEEIVGRFNNDLPSLTMMLQFAFAFGQRLGDAIQIALQDIVFGPHHICITIRRGKVMKTIQPYSLFLSNSSPLAPLLRRVFDQAISKNWLFLLSPNNSETDQDRIKAFFSTMLSAVDENLELRSVRRGALQTMAAAGFSVDNILLLSQHRSRDMLMRYLNWGQFLAEHSSKILSISDFMTAPSTVGESCRVASRTF